MLTNAERVLAAVRAAPGSTDGELRQRTGIDPHQQVNQICRRLEADGELRRDRRQDGLIGNYPVGGFAPRPERRSAEPARSSSILERSVPSDGLVLLPCSAAKRSGGERGLVGPSVLQLLDSATADRLRAARAQIATAAHLDGTLVLPAWQRYEGTLYRSATQLAGMGEARRRVVILSGGYGIVLADEPIGTYDRRFSVSDWPTGLLEACLDEVAAAVGATTVLSFCARSTGYAELVRRLARRATADVVQASPNLAGRGGAIVLAPRAAGEAFDAYLSGQLVDGWRSSDGIPIRLERSSRVR